MTSDRHTPLRKPRVLVLCSTFPRWADDNVPDFIERLCAGLARNYRIVLLAPHHTGARTIERWSGFAVVRYKYFWPPRFQGLTYGGGILPNLARRPWLVLQLPLFMLAGACACRRLCSTRTFALAHAHWVVPQLVQVRLAFIGMRRPPQVLATSHGGDLWGFRTTLGHRVKRWALRTANAVTVVSNSMRPLVEALDYRKPLHVIPMGTETALFSPASEPARAERALFVGRLVEKKGVDTAIKALAHPGVPRHMTLSIVGEGPLRTELQELAKRLGVESRVHFMGWVARKDLVNVYRDHRVFVFPSVVSRSGDQEGLGLTLAEAMSTGCVVVASDLPAIRDLIINGVTGYAFPPGDDRCLADLLGRIAASPEHARQMAMRSRQHIVERFSMEKVAASFDAIYSRLIGDAGKESVRQ